MSVRLEWSKYEHPSVHRRDDTLADGNRVTEQFGLCVGTQVVEGSQLELLQLLNAAKEKLDRFAMMRARALAQWELGDPDWADRIIQAFLDPDDADAASALAEIEE